MIFIVLRIFSIPKNIHCTIVDHIVPGDDVH